MDDPSDGTLARAVAAGPDAKAEAALFTRLARRVHLYGRRHTRGSEAAWDLVQDTLMTVLSALREGRVTNPDRIGSFALGVARRIAIEDHRRSTRRSAILEAKISPLDLVEPAPSHAALDRERLYNCLDQLAARSRAILYMTFYAEEPVGVIAEEVGTTPGNVRVVRHRALAQVADCMGVSP
ncbi:MAG: RNA polymerase sigma-70 factor (ECF subfamily) [Myxococcota bacterium]|jgi:RNA polymerase sigma-70 factor (ECF subfamily)